MLKLKRNLRESMIGGVCSGLGDYTNMDPVIWRLIFIFGTIFTTFPFILPYIILWIILPIN